jgi:hypothetical protein
MRPDRKIHPEQETPAAQAGAAMTGLKKRPKDKI